MSGKSRFDLGRAFWLVLALLFLGTGCPEDNWKYTKAKKEVPFRPESLYEGDAGDVLVLGQRTVPDYFGTLTSIMSLGAGGQENWHADLYPEDEMGVLGEYVAASNDAGALLVAEQYLKSTVELPEISVRLWEVAPDGTVAHLAEIPLPERLFFPVEVLPTGDQVILVGNDWLRGLPLLLVGTRPDFADIAVVECALNFFVVFAALCPDGGVILAGKEPSFVAKVDLEGNLLWLNTEDFENTYAIEQIHVNADGLISVTEFSLQSRIGQDIHEKRFQQDGVLIGSHAIPVPLFQMATVATRVEADEPFAVYLIDDLNLLHPFPRGLRNTYYLGATIEHGLAARRKYIEPTRHTLQSSMDVLASPLYGYVVSLVKTTDFLRRDPENVTYGFTIRKLPLQWVTPFSARG
jgi:hypothetical protein